MRIKARKTSAVIASVVGVVAACSMAMTAPALAQSDHTTPSAQTLAKSAQITMHLQAQAAASNDCGDDTGLNLAEREFWRCTGTSLTSPWVGSTCTPGEYNAGTNYNVFWAINNCADRVWLHELTYPDFTEYGGFAYCVNPGPEAVWIPAAGDSDFPENIQVTDNDSPC